MKILVFNPYAVLGARFEADLEIIQGHLDQGDEVVFLTCNSELLTCDVNRLHDFLICAQCIGRRVAGISLLSSKIKVQSFLKLSDKNREELGALKVEFSGIDELKSYRIENFDVGWAVLCSIVSLTRDPTPDLQATADLVRELVISSFAVYRSIQNHLDQVKFDRVYVFNGRFGPLRAAIRACESRNIQFFTHEIGHDMNHYALFENVMQQDLNYNELDIPKRWVAAASSPDRNRIASQFFLDSRNGVVQSWFSFVKEQRDGLLPDNWDPGRKNVVIFSSSEDEFVALGEEWVGPIYGTQLEGLERILESLAGDHGAMHLYLRHHPNLRYVKNEYTRKLMDLKSDFLTVILPGDPISTYALIEAADKVLTFGSTVGIEAVYWGKPSILVGKCFYQRLGGTYNPSSHEEVIELLKADLPPKDKEAALVYGYYLKTFGVPFRYYRATDLLQGEFNGKKVENPRWASIILKTIERSFSLSYTLERLARNLIRFYTSRKLAVKLPMQDRA
jgi:hypothetical protein